MINAGHGLVYPRPDGRRSRCGGPRMCGRCRTDAAHKQATTDAEQAVITAALTWTAAGTHNRGTEEDALTAACGQLTAVRAAETDHRRTP